MANIRPLNGLEYLRNNTSLWIATIIEPTTLTIFCKICFDVSLFVV